ncbi:minor capsid protein [Leuconostoc gasicomitatum]|uniref:minor capsid protein n=1 Tax=Leuconostoc gasicomitatum TaxID=115778 RepID=UPI001CC3D88C|nr:minor capsid protein [Leuconostoc gasicomitatum]MBZ5971589.1 capsid protein [Leuconostoc gasicomitatum]
MAITLDFRRANNMLAQQNKAAAQYKAANQAMMAMEQFVPMSNQQKQNRLRTETSLSADGQHINYAIPYARAQFYGFTSSGAKIQNYTTPGTSRRWDLRLKGNKELMKTVTDAFGKELLS